MMRPQTEPSIAPSTESRAWQSFRGGLVGLAGVLCAAVASIGCGGATDEPGCNGVGCDDPDPRCNGNATSAAPDSNVPLQAGCNSCGCVDGRWSCTAVDCGGNSCVYGGQIRADGSSFPASDGCNQCSCDDGSVACTERACSEPLPCVRDGQVIQSFTTVPAGDGCNTCTCSYGSLQCTLIACNSGCYRDDECGDQQYCAFPVSSCASFGTAGSASAETEELRAPPGAPLAPGECRDRPRVCTDEESPVCGCDGQTYYSACSAASRGVNLLSTSACPTN
jgi:hypothetical protein